MSESARNAIDVEGEGAELRAAPRYTLLLRTAKLVGPACEYLCVVRDVSATGISVRTFHRLPEGPLELEMPNGDRHPVETVWENEGAAGFRFSGEVDVDRLIADKGRFPKRGVRLHMRLPVTIESLGRMHDGVILNLSQQGARIECRDRLALDQKVRLEHKGFAPIRAVVRWRKDHEYGLAFIDTFQFAELARLVCDLHGKARTEFTTAEQLREGGV